MPTATAEQHHQLAVDSLNRATADQALQAWVDGQDDRQLCRRLELEGWDHLPADGPVIFAIAATGLPLLATRVLTLYRNALDAHAVSSDELAELMAEGRSVSCRLGVHHEPHSVPWLEGETQANTLAAQLALDHGAPLVPVMAEGSENNGLCFTISPPIQPTSADDLTELSAACLAAWVTDIDLAGWHWHSLPAAEEPRD